MRMRKYKDIVVLNTRTKGSGVFVLKNFLKGEVIVIGRIMRLVRERTNYSFQVDFNKHVDLDEPARLINHSCEPNCGIRSNKFGGYNFIAIKNIKKDEELCWDYCMSEYISIAVKKCSCGAKYCRGEIKGWKYLPYNIKNRYRYYTATYLTQWYNK